MTKIDKIEKAEEKKGVDKKIGDKKKRRAKKKKIQDVFGKRTKKRKSSVALETDLQHVYDIRTGKEIILEAEDWAEVEVEVHEENMAAEASIILFLYTIACTHFGRITALLIYTAFGSVIFMALEGEWQDFETERISFWIDDMALLQSEDIFNNTVTQTFGNEDDKKEMIDKSMNRLEASIFNETSAIKHDNIERKFDIWSSLFYCCTIITTVGYGNIYATTTPGQIATVFYALFGIPLCILVLFDLGVVLKRGFRFIWVIFYHHVIAFSNDEIQELEIATHVDKVKNVEDDQDDDDFNLPIIVAVCVLGLYILFGSYVYIQWERWTTARSFYFLFITFSLEILACRVYTLNHWYIMSNTTFHLLRTVGFGDVVPEHPKYFMISTPYILFGLSLVSMVINLIVNFLQTTLDDAQATVGLYDDDDSDDSSDDFIEVNIQK